MLRYTGQNFTVDLLVLFFGKKKFNMDALKQSYMYYISLHCKKMLFKVFLTTVGAIFNMCDSVNKNRIDKI